MKLTILYGLTNLEKQKVSREYEKLRQKKKTQPCQKVKRKIKVIEKLFSKGDDKTLQF